MTTYMQRSSRRRRRTDPIPQKLVKKTRFPLADKFWNGDEYTPDLVARLLLRTPATDTERVLIRRNLLNIRKRLLKEKQ